MRHHRAKDQQQAGTRDATQPIVPGEIVPWEGGRVADRGGEGDQGRTLVQRYEGERPPPGGPKVVRVRRSLLLTLVCLLIVAAFAIAGLVRFLPVRTTVVTSSTISPSTATSASSAQASATGTQPSPASSASNGSASSGATGSVTTGASTSPTATGNIVAATGGGPGAPLADLSALTPVSRQNVTDESTGPQQVGAVTYENSVRFTCYASSGSDIVYDVAGYKYLNTVVGIPSNASNAVGNSMTFTFYKDGSATQLSTPVTVSLDHPQSVHLNLQGSSQLEIACSAINTSSQAKTDMDVALGNATIGSS
jgi:hypothetical protein